MEVNISMHIVLNSFSHHYACPTIHHKWALLMKRVELIYIRFISPKGFNHILNWLYMEMRFAYICKSIKQDGIVFATSNKQKQSYICYRHNFNLLNIFCRRMKRKQKSETPIHLLWYTSLYLYNKRAETRKI